MGWYSERLLPRLIDRACGVEELAPLRQRGCAGLRGKVVEVGFGSGLNVEHYPSTVDTVSAIEPSDLAWSLAAERLAGSRVPVERVGLDGERLPLPDDSCDSALSTWTLCSIPDVHTALGELRRVLKPGGRFHFLDHGLAPDEKVRRWQRRLEPIHKRLVGGCHLTREIVPLLQEAGFDVIEVDHFYDGASSRLTSADALGVAVAR